MSHNKKDSLGDRMKEYESRNQYYLQKRTPVILRLDMRAGHSFTKGLQKPFDNIFMNTMIATMEQCCEEIQNCVFGYTQSDEITLVLCDYKKLNTSAWFDNNVLKICSVAASTATMAFNREFAHQVRRYKEEKHIKKDLFYSTYKDHYYQIIYKAINKAIFDARCFNIPKEEVCNCLIWRQQDAIRNSIEGLGQAYFSSKQLHKKSCEMIKEMLLSEKNIDWNDTPTKFKRGSCCIRDEFGEWIIDNEIPIFTGDRDYIEKRIVFDE